MSPAAETYQCLLKELDQLIMDGKGDSDEADAIRDEMDGPWYQMSDEEIKTIYPERQA